MNPEALLLKDRHQAGLLLADKLRGWRERSNTLVLALPRGGVPVGFAIAEVLHLPLDVLVVRKLGVPMHEEFAMGAIAIGGQTVLSSETVALEHLTQSQLDQVIERESAEMKRREQRYRGSRMPLDMTKKNVILVDDGMATGNTMHAATLAARTGHAAHITVAVPVLSDSAFVKIRDVADELVYLQMPAQFYAVGQWYEDFRQTSDEEVIALLTQAENIIPHHSSQHSSQHNPQVST